VDFQTDYPQFNTFMINGGSPNSINSGRADLKLKLNVREKLCSRIVKQENQTEKLYEKRINTRGKELQDIKLKFHPTEGYVFFKFSSLNMSRDSYIPQSLVFNVNATYKDPLLLKKDSHFICFEDKKLYVYKRVEAISRKNEITKNNDIEKTDQSEIDEDEHETPNEDQQMTENIHKGKSSSRLSEGMSSIKLPEKLEESDLLKDETENDIEEEIDEPVKVIYEDAVYTYDLNDFSMMPT
jgi:hypothetical protein